jgi:hypothetical protein
MSQSAYLYFTEGSSVPSVTLEELEGYLLRYREQTAKTGEQLDWSYADAAFPYTIEKKPEGDGVWFYLKAKDEPYKYIVFGVGSKTENDAQKHYVHVVLPDGSTHADKSKGNELCKYLARTLKTELHLFNGRVMYFNPRK